MSAVNPLRAAVVATLKTIPSLSDPTFGGRVFHEGEVARETKLPRIVVGSAFETPRGASRYGQRGYAGTLMLKCWAEDSWDAQMLYDEAEVRLQGVMLVIDGHTSVLSILERVTDFPDPDPEVNAHVVAGRLSTEARVVM
jgi:hypothetical protein